MQLRHLPVEEREQQRADVAAVHVGVRHQDDAVVARLLRVVVLAADPRAQRGDQRHDLRAREHLLEARLLDVQDLAAQREDGLVAPVAALLGRAACGVTLDDVELALARVPALAVGELARQRAAVQHALAAHRLARLARGDARPRGVANLRDDLLADVGVLLEEGGELLVHHLLDQALHLAVAQLRLRLPLELGVGQLDGDDGGEPLARVLARGRLLQVLPQPALLGVAVDACA